MPILNFFDTETTGLSYRNGDKIIEMCFATMDASTKQPLHLYDFKLNPEGRKSNPAAFLVHRITDHSLVNEPKFRDYGPFILQTLKNSINIGHNIEAFDLGFVLQEMYNCGCPREQFLGIKYIDTLILARSQAKHGKNKLDDLCLIYDIDTTSRTEKHSAYVDVMLNEKVFWKLLEDNDYADFIKVVDEKYLDKKLSLRGDEIPFSAMNYDVKQQIPDDVHIKEYLKIVKPRFKRAQKSFVSREAQYTDIHDTQYVCIETFGKKHLIFPDLFIETLQKFNILTKSNYATAQAIREAKIKYIDIKNTDQVKMLFRKKILEDMFENNQVIMRFFQENTKVMALNHITGTNYKLLDISEIDRVKLAVETPGQQLELFAEEALEKIQAKKFANSEEKIQARRDYFPRLLVV